MQKRYSKLLFTVVACLGLGLCSSVVSAQSSRSTEDILASRTYESKTKKKRSIFKKKSKSPYKTEDQLQAEYVQRMKDNAKRHDKEGRMSDKPQYSDPSYFGHKRPPKKRKNGKKKFCKECGLTH